MKRILRNILLTLSATLFSIVVWADGAITFEVNTPLIVSTGEMFRIEFILTNGKPDGDSFVAPDFAGLDILAGPTTSQARSYQNINGVASQSSTYTITYVVTAQKAGNLTIGQASVKVDNKSYTTKSTPIEVIEQSRKQEQEAAAQQGTAVQNQIAQDDILLRLNLSRTTVYQGEPLRASLTLYTRAGIAGFEDVKLPSFNGFWSQELPTDNYQAKRETLDGKVYDSQIIKEWLLYPQQSGTLSIESADITAVAQVVMRSNRNFDPFFGGGAEVYNVKRQLSTGKINVTVKNLPAGAPASFNGAVGKFSMTATPPASQLKANSAATYTVKISGIGNLTFLQTPTLTLPSSFELYNVRQTEAIQTSTNGTSGYRQFEYPFIARAEGEYDINPIQFTFFDPEKEGYVTLSTDSLKINVEPDGSASATTPQQIITGTTKEGVRQLGSDIRFIKLGKPTLKASTTPLIFSSTYFLILTLLLAVFVVAYLLLKKRIKDSKNTVLLRNRRANKVAIQRFRMAEKYMREMNRHAFYEEMLRALWGYMGDKLNIPVANLTKEGIREELQRRGCPQQDAKQFTEIITRCDEAQYSPAEWVQMNDVYAEGVRIISRIEQIIKR